jgi:hypothetical protein
VLPPPARIAPVSGRRIHGVVHEQCVFVRYSCMRRSSARTILKLRRHPRSLRMTQRCFRSLKTLWLEDQRSQSVHLPFTIYHLPFTKKMSSQFSAIRRTQTLEAQLGRLRTQVGSVKSNVKAIVPGITLAHIPSWDVVRQDTGTFTPGTDWEDQFEDESITTRVQHSMRTACGEISHVNSDHSATRLRIRFTSQGQNTLKMKLGIVGSGRVQVKANGDIDEYTSGGFIDISQVAPPLTNELVVMADGTGGAFQFSLDGLLFDGENRKWVSY